MILADNDGAGIGLAAAKRAAGRLHAQGRRVWIVHPPDAGEDFNDLLHRGGPDLVRKVVEAGPEWQAEAAPAAEEENEPELGTHQPIGFRPPNPPLPLMRANDGQLALLTDRSWSLLFAVNTPPWLYRCGGATHPASSATVTVAPSRGP